MASEVEQKMLNQKDEEKEIGVQSNTIVQDISQITEIKEKIKKPYITTSLILLMIVNIIMLVVGVTNTKNCPIDDRIPMYLIAAGALGIITKILPFFIYKTNEASIGHHCLVCLVSALYIIEFIFMILGSIWVYSIYKPNYKPDQGLYCNRTTYLLAFWLLTVHYILLAICLLIMLCFCAISFCVAVASM